MNATSHYWFNLVASHFAIPRIFHTDVLCSVTCQSKGFYSHAQFLGRVSSLDQTRWQIVWQKPHSRQLSANGATALARCVICVVVHGCACPVWSKSRIGGIEGSWSRELWRSTIGGCRRRSRTTRRSWSGSPFGILSMLESIFQLCLQGHYDLAEE